MPAAGILLEVKCSCRTSFLGVMYNVLHSGTELEFNEGDENGLGNK
jgi:hypothetical protein